MFTQLLRSANLALILMRSLLFQLISAPHFILFHMPQDVIFFHLIMAIKISSPLSGFPRNVYVEGASCIHMRQFLCGQRILFTLTLWSA